ncbi:MAG: UDP-2,3-diacylglucosamine diphosphatase [Candidatus Heimdallarchaeota archaeon]|nr:MAG: UDP-2,3-diacylglucosamine diphosphatase [Candidatus Heimdallarchaeota archaeon]
MNEIGTDPIPVENLKDEKIIAVSDVHLGYSACNKEDFDEFINGLRATKCDRLVICGDFLDMWRRDPVGVTLENSDTLNRLKVLQDSENIEVNFVVGNHDFYLRHFKEGKFAYDFSFDRQLILADSNEDVEYWFLHGDTFDIIQNEIFYDPLCLANDDAGKLAELAWQFYLQRLSWIQKIIKMLQGFKRNLLEPLKPAESRFTTDILELISKQPRNSPELAEMLTLDLFESTERKVIKWATNQEKLRILTFGHTHQPFVHVEGNVSIANTGSWVNSPGSRQTNTYVMIHKHQQSLWPFRGNQPLLSTVNNDHGVPTGLSIPNG